MSDDPKLPIRDTAALTIDIVTGSPVGSVLNAGFNLVGGFIERGSTRRAQRAYDVLVDEWAAVARMTPEEAEPEVRRLLTEGCPDADDELHEAFRKMNSSSSGRSWPYIARMFATYKQLDLGADTFFRRCGWLLERCDDVDIDLLVRLMRWTREAIIGLDPVRHYGILWSLDDRKNSLSAYPLLLGDHPDTSVGGVVEGEHEGDAASIHQLLSESRVVSWRKQGHLAFRAADDALVALVELFTGPLPPEAVKRLRAVKTR